MKRTPRHLPFIPYLGLQPLLNGEGGGGSGAGAGAGSGGAGQGGGPDAGADGGQGGTGEGQDKKFTQDDVDRIVKERALREVRSKYGDYDELKAKADELDKLKESQATDQEKAVTKARKEGEAAARGQLEPQMHRLMAALKHGLPEELGARVLSAAKRLVGSNLEELEADAKEFFATSPITASNAGGAGGAGGGFAQGVRGGGGAPKAGLASGADLYRERHGSKTKTT